MPASKLQPINPIATGGADDAATNSTPRGVQTMRCLLRNILGGVYAPGDRIREAEVAQRLGISRAPVREALRILEQDGLIEILPWRGARVIDPDPAEIADLFDLLGAVYGAVARFAVRHATDAELQRFYVEIAEFVEGVTQKREVIDLVDLAYRMGTHLGQCCGNVLAANMLRRLGRIAYLRHRYLSPVPARWLQQAITRLRRFEAALRARSEDRSERAGRRVIQHTATLVLRHAQQAQSGRIQS